MGIDLSALVAQVGKELQTESIKPLIADLERTQGEIRQWLNRAYNYINLEENSTMNLGRRAQSNIQKYSNKNISSGSYNEAFWSHLPDQYKQMEKARQEVLDRKVLYDGYALLNQIGESARGGKDVIQYSVTVTGSGDWGADFGEAITWMVDYDIFTSLTTTSRSRIIMADSNSMLSRLKESGIEPLERWNEEKVKMYQDFHIYANKNRDVDKQLNYGNTLEAFLRWQKSNGQLSWGAAIHETLKNSLPFYAGGDIGNIQVKGMNASVANINTMINALSKADKNITTIIQRCQRLSQRPPKTKAGSMRLNASIDKAIRQMLAQFGFQG